MLNRNLIGSALGPRYWSLSLGRGFRKIRSTLLGVPIRRTIVFWGLYWGCPYFGKLPDSDYSYSQSRNTMDLQQIYGFAGLRFP